MGQTDPADLGSSKHGSFMEYYKPKHFNASFKRKLQILETTNRCLENKKLCGRSILRSVDIGPSMGYLLKSAADKLR